MQSHILPFFISVINMHLIFLIAAVTLFSGGSLGSFGPFKQDSGYVEVRPGAHMFWWLFYTTADVATYTDRPLIVWLQGGPGGSSTGYGNFEMIGPLDLALENRNTSWVRNFNLMFIDNPVGTGFSYVENSNLLTTTNEQIGIDLVSLMRGFYNLHPEFQTVPFYIYGQSYGGKMAVDFALQLHSANKAGTIQSNLKGMAMGNAWIEPVSMTLSWAPFLQSVSLIDQDGYDDIMNVAQTVKTAFNLGQYTLSTNNWRLTQMAVLRRTNNVDFYNILTKASRYSLFMRSDEEKIFDMLTYSKYYSRQDWNLDLLMNTEVKRALGIPDRVQWSSSSNAVFNTLSGDFMKPVVEGVERLLNETDVTVMVYNGNLDLICDTPGQIEWVSSLRWDGAEGYRKSQRLPVWEKNILEGYYKSYRNFRFYWVNVAGHSAPLENPAAADAFLRDMTSFG